MKGLWILVFISIAFYSCFEPKEGCLDIAAVNYDATADNDCCCKYPKVVLTVNQVYDTLLFKNDELYPDQNGHLFRIKSVAFYLSDFQFVQNGTAYKVADTLTLYTFQGNDTLPQVFTNDFQLVRRATIDYTVGDFRPDGIFSDVAFRFGLSPAAQAVIPAKSPANHPLSVQADELWRGKTEGFAFLQAVVVRDSMADTKADTLRFLQSDLGQPVIGATGQFLHPTGYNFPLLLTVDYQKMFALVDWSVHDVAAWKAQIVANLPSTFSLGQ